MKNQDDFETMLVGQYIAGSMGADLEERYLNIKDLAKILAENLGMQKLAKVIEWANFGVLDEQDH